MQHRREQKAHNLKKGPEGRCLISFPRDMNESAKALHSKSGVCRSYKVWDELENKAVCHNSAQETA